MQQTIDSITALLPLVAMSEWVGCDLEEDESGRVQKLLFADRLGGVLFSRFRRNNRKDDDLLEKAVLNDIRSRMVASLPNEKDVLLSSKRC